MAETSDRSKESGTSILTLHGEGLQGLTIINLVDELCSQIKQAGGYEAHPAPCDLFDVICGTGIGALLALLFGRYACSISKCKQIYMDLAGFVEERNKSHRFHSQHIREEVVEDFLHELIGAEGWSDNFNVFSSERDVRCQRVILVSNRKSGHRSNIEIYRGIRISPSTSISPISPTLQDDQVAAKTAMAVAHPVVSRNALVYQQQTSRESHIQQLHDVIPLSVIETATAGLTASSVSCLVNVGTLYETPSKSPSGDSPQSPGQWMMDKALPIGSAFMHPVKTTLKIVSPQYHGGFATNLNNNDTSATMHRRAKSLSHLQWPFQGSTASNSISCAKNAHDEIEMRMKDTETNLLRSLLRADRVFNLIRTIPVTESNNGDIFDLKDTRSNIKEMITFSNNSGLLPEIVACYLGK